MDTSKQIAADVWIVMTIPNPPGWKWAIGRLDGTRLDITLSGHASTLVHAKRDAYQAITSMCTSLEPDSVAKTILFLSEY